MEAVIQSELKMTYVHCHLVYHVLMKMVLLLRI